MPLNPDIIISKANELKEARERVSILEAELKALIADGEGRAPSYLWNQSDLNDAAPLTDKIVSLLEGSPGRVFYFKEIFKTVGGKDNEASVRSTIAKLINDKRIARSEWGQYRAVSKEERPKAG